MATKVKIPPQPPRVVPRRRLTDALERGIPHYKLTLISAPAGYGKTTLLSQWAHSSRFPAVWLSLGEEDNDRERFLRYLVAAWEEIQPAVLESRLDLLLGSMALDPEAVLPEFINVANDIPDHVVFVLDDYHVIEDTSIHQALAFLLNHLPHTVHFVLAARGEPPLPIARYRARNDLLEFGTGELRFLQDETADFLNLVMDLELTQNQIAGLQDQLEGWIAGLQLMALTLQRRITGGDKLVVSGSHRFIADYLGEDVLAPLQPGIRQFLLQTSITDRLCGSLCDAISGEEGGQEMLEFLERESLFLSPLDDNREWFRYHHLFAEYLRETLRRRFPEQVADLHSRAARWYLAHDLPEPAFHHAVDGNDAELVSQILGRYFIPKLLGGEVRDVKRWLELLPAAWQSSHPMIGFAQAGILMVTGQFDACANYLNKVEQHTLAGREDADLHRARVTAMRCNIACFQNDLAQAEIFAVQALQTLHRDDLDFIAGIYGALGDTYRRNGRWQEAQESYLALMDYTHAPAFRVLAVHVFGALADLSLRQGHLLDAAGYWRKALAAIKERENWGSYPLPLTGWVYIRLGELLYEWDEVPEAWDHLSRGLERAELGGDVLALIAGYLIAGRVKLTEGNSEAAADYLEQARLQVETAQFAHWTSRFERFQLELWLAQDKLRTAVVWSDQMLRQTAIEQRPESEVAQLAMARVLIVQGDEVSLERAFARLERLLQTAEEAGRMGIMIEALALQALAHWTRGERPDALTALERALRLAEPEGYVRLFADLGLPMARLLHEARSRDVMPDYVAKLLAAFVAADVPPSTPAPPVLPEPLTSREHEVLVLVAAGLTNREIAGKLVISPETVKKHTGNIYGKLGVSNRTEATARARDLDLLT